MDPKFSGPPGGAGFRLVAFPKEFERSYWETFDTRYYSILLASFIILYSSAFFVAFQDWTLSQDQINAMKERAIQKIYEVDIVDLNDDPLPEEPITAGNSEPEEVEEKPEEVSEKGKERVEESQTQRTTRRERTQEDIAAKSRQMQQEVGSQGILAIATSAGGSGAGDVAYNDALQGISSGAGGIGDIGSLVEGTDGIRTANSGSDRTRAVKGSGQRQDGSGTGIDDLISGESVSGNAKFSRRGEIKLSSDNVKLTAGAGSRDSEAITNSINQQRRSVEYCYQKRAKINPNLKGRIDLEIEIDATGRVSRVRTLKSTLGDSKLDKCIIRAIKRWRFGKVDKGNVKIRVPLIF